MKTVSVNKCLHRYGCDSGGWKVAAEWDGGWRVSLFFAFFFLTQGTCAYPNLNTALVKRESVDMRSRITWLCLFIVCFLSLACKPTQNQRRCCNFVCPVPTGGSGTQEMCRISWLLQAVNIIGTNLKPWEKIANARN